MKDCNRCGKCCVKYGNQRLSATAEEIEMWQLFNPEIAEHVHQGKIWHDPETAKPLSLCPWLRKQPGQNLYTCDIYYDRPEDCRFYPVTIKQMIADECEMLEPEDLVNPKSAQQQLDKLMKDSRPAFENK